jgi:hypothetical protein
MKKGRNLNQGGNAVRVGMAAASMVSRTILFIWNGRLLLCGVGGDAFEILVSMRKLTASHHQDGYRPKNAKMLETKFHLIGHTADQPKFVNTSLKNRQKN